jgi:hypothetical protein
MFDPLCLMFAPRAVHGITEAVMDARERFQKVVVPSYNRFVASPNDFSMLDNLIASMNPMAEYLGLDRRGYPPGISRNERRREAQAIRDDSDLTDVQICADVIKHVRIELEQDGVTSTLSSTGIDTADPKTWKISGLDLVRVAHRAFATLSKIPRPALRPMSDWPRKMGEGK